MDPGGRLVTGMDACLLTCGFVGFLLVLTALFEQTERGRRLTERAIRRILR